MRFQILHIVKGAASNKKSIFVVALTLPRSPFLAVQPQKLDFFGGGTSMIRFTVVILMFPRTIFQVAPLQLLDVFRGHLSLDWLTFVAVWSCPGPLLQQCYFRHWSSSQVPHPSADWQLFPLETCPGHRLELCYFRHRISSQVLHPSVDWQPGSRPHQRSPGPLLRRCDFRDWSSPQVPHPSVDWQLFPLKACPGKRFQLCDCASGLHRRCHIHK